MTLSDTSWGLTWRRRGTKWRLCEPSTLMLRTLPLQCLVQIGTLPIFFSLYQTRTSAAARGRLLVWSNNSLSPSSYAGKQFIGDDEAPNRAPVREDDHLRDIRFLYSRPREYRFSGSIGVRTTSKHTTQTCHEWCCSASYHHLLDDSKKMSPSFRCLTSPLSQCWLWSDRWHRADRRHPCTRPSQMALCAHSATQHKHSDSAAVLVAEDTTGHFVLLEELVPWYRRIALIGLARQGTIAFWC